MMRRTIACLAVAAALLGSCRPSAPLGWISVSAIGPTDPTRAGLVRLDRTGQVVPALALRWAILEDGRGYLFRVDDTAGSPSAATIARALRRILVARLPRGEAPPMWGASVQAVTPTVVEVKLARPRPDLLQLLARPPFDLADAGPFVVAARLRDAVLLRPREPGTALPVLLRVEPAGRAVARFSAGAAALVTGGGFADLPIVRVAGVDPRLVRFDPATGLFGFAPVAGSRFADPALVRALDLALDRGRIAGDFAVPGSAAAAGPPSDDQRAEARALVARGGALPPLRVALPKGAGARLLFARAARDWRAIGVSAISVAADAPADLVLVDRVVPPENIYREACAVSPGCDPGDPRARPSFIAIANPVRWSLVARELDGFATNTLAAHPLDQLREPR